jgi:hypothetical protein
MSFFRAVLFTPKVAAILRVARLEKFNTKLCGENFAVIENICTFAAVSKN